MAARRLAVTSSSLHALLASLQSHNTTGSLYSLSVRAGAPSKLCFPLRAWMERKRKGMDFFLRMKKGKDSSKTRRESRVIDPDTESESESLGGESESSRKSRFGDSSASRVRVI